MKLTINKENGQALVVFALAAIGIFAIVALAIDGSAKFSDQRHAQNAADTAALAAALAKVNSLAAGDSNSPSTCPPPSGSPSTVCSVLQLAGINRAIDNGYSNTSASTVKIYSPPISGYYAGNDQYVQVIITSDVNTYFARVIGIKQTKNIVQAVAFAKPGYNLTDGAMIISYDPDPNCSTGGTGGYSVTVTGNATVNLTGGGIFLNSDEVCGFTIPNCADLNITSGAGISSVGSDNIDQGSCADQAPEFPNQEPVVIPDEVYWPPTPPECSMSGSPTPYKFPTQILGYDGKLHDQWLIYPGFYPEFPQATLVTNKSYIYMASGVYCIDTGGHTLSWSSVDAAFLNGSTDPVKNPKASYNPNGVTLYLKGGVGFTFNGNSPTFMDASNNPSSDYQGYLMIVEGTPTSHPSCTMNGGANLDVNGLFFAPYCDFTINGQAGETAAFNAQLIGWDIKINGSNAINFNYDPSNQVKIKRKIGLMK